MGYLPKLTEREEKVRLCNDISSKDIREYIRKHEKDFTLFRIDGQNKLLNEEPNEFLKKFVNNRVVTSFLELTITKQIRLIDKKIKEGKAKTNSHIDSLIKALIGTIFENNVDLYFKLTENDNKNMESLIAQQLAQYKKTGVIPIFAKGSEEISGNSQNGKTNFTPTIISLPPTPKQFTNPNPTSISVHTSEISVENPENKQKLKGNNETKLTDDQKDNKTVNPTKVPLLTIGVAEKELSLDDFEELINNYNDQSKILEKSLKENLENVSLGIAPDPEKITLVNNQLFQLRHTYEQIRLLAKNYSELGDIPNNVSIPEFTRIIKQAIFKRKIKETENKLNAFISIQSLFDDYAKALSPYQKQAFELLNKLSNITLEIPEDIAETAETSDNFVVLLLLDSLDCPKGEELLDKICDKYSVKVQRGIFLKKYLLPDELSNYFNTKKKLIGVNTTEQITEPQPTQQPESQPIQETETQPTQQPESQPIQETEPQPTQQPELQLIQELEPQATQEPEHEHEHEHEHEPNLPQEPEPEFVSESFIKKDGFLVSSFPINDYSDPSKFKKSINELEKSCKQVLALFPLISFFGFIKPQQLLDLSKHIKNNSYELTIEDIINTLTKLTEEKILTSYKFNEEEFVFALTPYAVKAINTIECNRINWIVQPIKPCLFAQQEIEESLVIKTLYKVDFIVDYLNRKNSNFSKNNGKQFLKSIRNEKNKTTLTINFCKRKYNLRFIDSIEELNNNYNSVILVSDNNDNNSFPDLISTDTKSNVFFYKSFLYKWDGHGWKKEEDYGEPVSSESVGKPENLVDSGKPKPESEPEPELELEQEHILPVKLLDSFISFIENEDNEFNPILPYVDNTNEEIQDYKKESVSLIIDEDISVYGISEETSSVEIAKNILNNHIGIEHYLVYKKLINKLISENRVKAEDDLVENSLSQAIVLSKSLSFYNQKYLEDYRRLLLAMDSSIEEHQYTSIEISNIFENETSHTNDIPVLKLMAVLRGLFSNNAYDYNLINYAKSLFKSFESHFENLQILKSLYSLFLKINEITMTGFTIPILQIFSDENEKAELLKSVQLAAFENLTEPISKSSTLLRAISPLPTKCFGIDSDMHFCMKAISNNNLEQREIVALYFDDFCEILDNKKEISDSKIEKIMDKKLWDIENDLNTKVPQKVWYPKISELYKTRLKIIEKWLEVTSPTEKGVAQKLTGLRKEILSNIDLILHNLDNQVTSKFDIAIIRKMLNHFKDELNGNFLGSKEEFSDFLRTGLFCQGRNYVPFIDEYFVSISYYEPWRNILKHIIKPVEGLREVLGKITQQEYPYLYDNLGQSLLILQYLNEKSKLKEKEDIYKYFADLSNSIKTIKGNIAEFQGKLEMAFAYGRISERLKEDINDGIVNVYQKITSFYNYGCIRAFLDSQEQVIEESKNKRLLELKQNVLERQNKTNLHSNTILLEKALEKLNAPENNFAVAEEYLNRYDSGVLDNMDIVDSTTVNHFKTFIENDFENLYDFCRKYKNKELTAFGCDFIEKELRKKKVSSQYYDSSRNLIKSIPFGVNVGDSNNKILRLLTELGYEVKSVNKMPISPGHNILHYSVEIVPDAKDKSEYSHPVDIMGTKLESPLDVFCLFGNVQPTDIVDKICKMERNRTALVILNGILSLLERRKMSEYFHKEKSNRNPFILIDRVLLLYLALFPKNERLPIMLNCTLPFTSNFKPFVMRGSVSDEMFIGRKKELNQIIDPNGPVILYGGRQLGKTALLERALSLTNHPSKKEYTILIRATDIPDEPSFVRAIIRELKTLNMQIGSFDSLNKLCDDLKNRYKKKEWEKILILVDESDKLLESFKKLIPTYKPIIPLSDLSRETGNKFKFVFAGLHNVFRAANDPNTIFGQLGSPLCITPLSSSDANELLSRPLNYLGFDINYSNLEHILVNTSFYPGIIHFVGYKLVENLANRYAMYYRAADGNPPYTLEGKQLGEIMSGNDLNEEINKRIRWTLEVDPRYFMLARCIAYLYIESNENNKLGHSLDSIIEYAKCLEIHCLENQSSVIIRSLLKEMVDMGILVETSEDRFRLRQRRFLDAIGTTIEKIEKDIKDSNGEPND